MTNDEVCLTTKRKVMNDKGSTSFKCPNCGEYTIVRSSVARKLCVKYTCPNCKFEGPN